jgi:NAD(P)-dependent dehydrogenase (short-subunit alcohol dehydrogenase family)
MTPPAGRVAIVTGAGRGLGRAIADRLLADGWLVATADVDLQSVNGDRSLPLRCDVSSEPEVAALVEATVERFGRIDAVVNNAGIGGPSRPVVDLDPSDFLRVLQVNLLGTFLVSRAAAPVMIAAGRGGRIVNLGSLFGQQAVADGAAYCASKGGVALLTQSLALELAPHGITANTVAPGNMWTQMHEAEVSYRASQSGRTLVEEKELVRREIPLGRHGTGEDIAGAVSWLLSEDAANVTGQTVSVNGGVYLT